MNRLFGKILLSTAYFPPIEWFIALINADETYLEQWEHYQKQSYRSRCNILSSNGSQTLSVPLKRDGSHKLPIREIEIDYSLPWLMQHKRSITAAYNSSPFFEHYQDEIFEILDREERYLFDLNNKLMVKLLEFIGYDSAVGFTEKYINRADLSEDVVDMRDDIHPKKESPIPDIDIKEKPYYQVFSHKQGFISNLSILDLLSNEGPNSISYLSDH